ncbi:hypothetical protein BpHYR1_014632 [Brachionus plicatilis]|uniref:Uncharacterized protein n=1 Tax=Brachionus plicatilis TaxID=10195 RepID=A0A3M7T7L8_BRAPC|nr:hypothetical protein BpHYR1_014632 [Brachionus plicatilis]
MKHKIYLEINDDCIKYILKDIERLSPYASGQHQNQFVALYQNFYSFKKWKTKNGFFSFGATELKQKDESYSNND